MKKINIRTILPAGFALLFIIMLIFGTRELIVLNKQKELSDITIELFSDQSLLNENLMILKTENSLLKNLIITQDFNEFELLKTEHQSYVKQFNLNFKKLGRDNIEDKELIKAYNEQYTIYNKEFVENFALIAEKKENLLNFDTYYIENYSLTEQSETKLRKDIEDDIADLKIQTADIMRNMTAKLSVLLQKNAQLISQNKTSEENSFNRIRAVTFFVFLPLMIIVSVILLRFIQILIIYPIEKIYNQLDIITRGELPEDISINAGDEIVRISGSINKLVAGLRRIADFSLEIGKGNFSSDYKPLGEDDVLGNSLLTLRDNLQFANEEEEKRKREDAQRNRTNEGLTMFGRILSQQSGNISNLADDIISSLVKFTNSNQGALFFLNEDDPENIHYELLGAYAYNRKKHLSKQIKPGEGLVGAVAIEKYSVYMTDVPDEYIEIESGTGSANPRSVLIVPLKIEENVLGVIELASFSSFEEYEIKMVERIADTIASSLANARINMQTAKLLEQSKDQEKLVVEQENELLQNMNEIKTLNKKIKDLTKEIENLKTK